MKNTIQITLAIAVFFALIFFIKNTFFKEKNCLNDYPEIIKKYNLEGKYDTARWVLYALNSTDEHTLVRYADREVGKLLYEYIECELYLLQSDSSEIFDEKGLFLSFFPKKGDYGALQSPKRGLSHTIIFRDDTIWSFGNGSVYFEYPSSYTQERERKFIDCINQNYDIAHCWLKQYYEKHKKINRVQ